MFRLHGCPEDDTIFSECTIVLFGAVVYEAQTSQSKALRPRYFRPGVGAPGRFCYSDSSLSKVLLSLCSQ